MNKPELTIRDSSEKIVINISHETNEWNKAAVEQIGGNREKLLAHLKSDKIRDASGNLILSILQRTNEQNKFALGLKE